MPDIVELTLCMSDRTDPQLAFNTRSGGIAIDGSEQILSPLSERWTFSAVFPIFNERQARTIRVAKSKLKGNFNYLMLRLCDQYRITRRDIGAVYNGSSVPHSDDTFFSDGSGYKLASPTSPIMQAAAANADEILVRASDFAGGITAGVFFSINYYLYQVDDWELDGEEPEESVYRLKISPPLREAVTTTDEADFDAKSLWRLESADDGALALRIGKFGAVTLNLVEPIGR